MIVSMSLYRFTLYVFVLLSLIGVFALSSIPNYAAVVQPDLRTAINFSVLAGSEITNTGSTVIGPPSPAPVLSGNLGLHPGTDVTGFDFSPAPNTGVGQVLAPGEVEITTAVALQAQTDLTLAYNQLVGQSPCTILPNTIGDLLLTPGIYCFTTSPPPAVVLLAGGTLTLDHLNDPNALFVFQVPNQLTTDTGYTVASVNTGNINAACNVWWQVGSSATLGTNTSFIGNILALTSISLATGTILSPGRALARNGAVTLDTNTINMGDCDSVAATSTPRPTSTPLPTNTPTPVPVPTDTPTPSPTPISLLSSVTQLPSTGERADYRLPIMLIVGFGLLLPSLWFYRRRQKKL